MLTTEPRLNVDAIIVYPASMLKSIFCVYALAKRCMTAESLALTGTKGGSYDKKITKQGFASFLDFKRRVLSEFLVSKLQ